MDGTVNRASQASSLEMVGRNGCGPHPPDRDGGRSAGPRDANAHDSRDLTTLGLACRHIQGETATLVTALQGKDMDYA
jgi:hypothetical protein